MAAYPKPTGNSGIYNNQSFVNPDNQGGLTVEEGKKYFVTYPTTQSPSTITANNFTTTGALNVAGASQFGGDATFIGGATITGPLTFSDNVEVKGTTTLDANLLCLTTATIDGELTSGGGILMQPISPATNSIIDFVNAGGEVQLYLDPTVAYDMVFQSAQADGIAGLSVINATSSFTMNCATWSTGLTGLSMRNPINMGSFGLYGLSGLYAGTSYTTPVLSLTTGTVGFNNNNLSQVGVIYVGNNVGANYTTISQTNGNFYISNTAPFANNPYIGLNLYTSVGFSNALNITPNLITIGSNFNMNVNNNNLTNLGAGSTAVTQDKQTNNTTIATTAFVQSLLPVYTQTTISIYTTLDPGICTLAPPYVQQTQQITTISNVKAVFFNNPIYFQITGSTAGLVVGTSIMISLQFSGIPWPDFPPPTGTYSIFGQSSSGQSINCNVNFLIFGSAFIMNVYWTYNIATGNNIILFPSSFGELTA
jgi:hypothetical protein